MELNAKLEEMAEKVRELEIELEDLRAIEVRTDEIKNRIHRIRSKIYYYVKKAKEIRERGTVKAIRPKRVNMTERITDLIEK